MALYVDDILLIGELNLINTFLRNIKTNFNVRYIANVTKFVGCQFEWNKDSKSVVLHQGDLVGQLIEAFKDEICTLRSCSTPGTPSAHRILHHPKSGSRSFCTQELSSKGSPR